MTKDMVAPGLIPALLPGHPSRTDIERKLSSRASELRNSQEHRPGEIRCSCEALRNEYIYIIYIYTIYNINIYTILYYNTIIHIILYRLYPSYIPVISQVKWLVGNIWGKGRKILGASWQHNSFLRASHFSAQGDGRSPEAQRAKRIGRREQREKRRDWDCIVIV